MKKFLTLAVLTFLSSCGVPAAAQGLQCAPREAMIEMLVNNYGETRQAMGLASPEAIMELYASEETGSWTIIMSLLSGDSCLLASGMNFHKTETPKGSLN